MAKIRDEAAAAITEALAVVRHIFDGIEVEVGSLIHGSPEQIAAHAAIGNVDPHPDTVAAAKAADAPVIDIEAAKAATADEAAATVASDKLDADAAADATHKAE